MKKISIIAASSALIAAAFGVAGCSNTDTATTLTTKSEAPGTATPVAFTNSEGQIVCPVMGTVTSEKDAVGYQDYNGKRYYFCCDDCPDKFKADPAKYANGKPAGAGKDKM
jgi:YHS domain-containing protein